MRVYFMTNRNQRQLMPFPEFDFTPTPNVTVGFADLDNPLTDEAAMRADAIELTVGGVDVVPPALTDDIKASKGNHLLLYFHGFNYSFRDAMLRTIWLAGWFGAAKTEAVAGPVVCFSFPSQGTMMSFERDAKGMNALFGGTYQSDYRRATESGPATARALELMTEIATAFRANRPQARVTLLAHSMGNHVLAAALDAARAANTLPETPPFDRVILAAADEAQSSVQPDGALRLAGTLAEKVYIYYDEGDWPLRISRGVHGNERLGRLGPARSGTPNRPFAVPETFQVINCSQVAPLDPQAISDWQHHQYYRLYEWVRDDMALVMGCRAADDVKDFPRRRLSFETPGLIDLDSPDMQEVSLTHPFIPLSTRD